MREKTYGCPVAVRNARRTRFVLWVEPTHGRNYLLKRGGRIVLAKSEPEFRRVLKTSHPPRVFWKWKSLIDLDAFHAKVAGLKSNTASKPSTCKVILDGWNFLEDIAFTVQAPESLKIFKKPGPVFKMYDKLFWGNNLPSVTPEGKEYWPIWTEPELRAFRPALRELMKLLHKRAPELLNG